MDGKPTDAEIDRALLNAYGPEVAMRFSSVPLAIARAASDAIFDNLVAQGFIRVPSFEKCHEFPGRLDAEANHPPGTEFDVVSPQGEACGRFQSPVAGTP